MGVLLPYSKWSYIRKHTQTGEFGKGKQYKNICELYIEIADDSEKINGCVLPI